jgi:hypothetical protein
MEVLKPFLYDSETRVRVFNAILDSGTDALWADCLLILPALGARWLDRMLLLRIDYRYPERGSERLAAVLWECSEQTYCVATAHLSYSAMERLWGVLRPSDNVAQRALALLALHRGPDLDAKTLFLASVEPLLDPFAVVIGVCSESTLRALLDAGRLPTARHLFDAALAGQFWLFVPYAPRCSFSPWLLNVTRTLIPGPVPEFLSAVAC